MTTSYSPHPTAYVVGQLSSEGELVAWRLVIEEADDDQSPNDEVSTDEGRAEP